MSESKKKIGQDRNDNKNGPTLIKESAMKEGTGINKNMTFGELLQKHPQVAPILAGYGLHCIGCHIGISETIEQGSRAHGIDDATLDRMISDLNTKAS